MTNSLQLTKTLTKISTELYDYIFLAGLFSPLLENLNRYHLRKRSTIYLLKDGNRLEKDFKSQP